MSDNKLNVQMCREQTCVDEKLKLIWIFENKRRSKTLDMSLSSTKTLLRLLWLTWQVKKHLKKVLQLLNIFYPGLEWWIVPAGLKHTTFFEGRLMPHICLWCINCHSVWLMILRFWVRHLRPCPRAAPCRCPPGGTDWRWSSGEGRG